MDSVKLEGSLLSGGPYTREERESLPLSEKIRIIEDRKWQRAGATVRRDRAMEGPGTTRIPVIRSDFEIDNARTFC